MTSSELNRRRFFELATGAAIGGSLGAKASAARPWCAGRIPEVAVPVLDRMCQLTPQQIEGPYYLNQRINRRDIREGRPGLPMDLYTLVVDVNKNCAPIPGAVFDVWHCDADRGIYSSFQAPNQTFLRGVQATDANGIAYVETIFPGWYPGRTTHIHAKVHLGDRTAVTTQLYFDEALPDLVYTILPPYTTRGRRNTTNARDRFFVPETVLTVIPHPTKPLTLLAGLVIGVA